MTLESLSLAGKTEVWRPIVPEFEPEISFYESQGGIARSIWQEKFQHLEEIVKGSSQVLFTGIGGGMASEDVTWATNGAKGVKYHGDGLQVPPYLDLKKTYGKDLRALFLVASTRTPDEMTGLVSVALEYRKQGVDNIFVVLGAFPHERQDHHFKDNGGNEINQAETLEAMILMMAGSKMFDGGLVLQPHSMQVTRIGLINGLPLLPIDASNLMLERSGVRKVVKPFVLGPDKGRRNVAMWLATKLNCPYGVCKKSRSRITDGLPEVEIPIKVLEYIKNNDCSPVIFDDEIREAGTAQALRRALAGWAKRFYMFAEKGFFADMNGKGITAAEALALPLEFEGQSYAYDEELIVVTDAVTPIKPIDPIAHKLQVLRLRQDVDYLTTYLQHNLVPNGNDLWLRDEKVMNTLLRLDLMVERYS